MRINKPGSPGRYRCDKCGEPSRKGVYTGHPGYEHVCVACLQHVCIDCHKDVRASFKRHAKGGNAGIKRPVGNSSNTALKFAHNGFLQAAESSNDTVEAVVAGKQSKLRASL